MMAHTKHKALLIIGIICCLSKLSYAQQVDTVRVFFQTGKFILSAKEQLKLTRIDTNNISGISILAFCDDRGNIENNNALSIKRANSVMHQLLQLNISKQRINRVAGKGELPVLALKNKNTYQQRAFNRRAEVIITYSANNQISGGEPKTSDLLKNLKVGDKIVLKNILFEGGRAKLLPESYADLVVLREFLKENSKVEILILGHVCCSQAGEDGKDFDTGLRNLSVVRAKTIYDYLIEKGINKNRLSYKGLKAEFPTGKDVKYDRRVEVELTDK